MAVYRSDVFRKWYDWLTGVFSPVVKVGDSAGNVIGSDNPMPVLLNGSNILDNLPVAVKRVSKIVTSTVINAQSVAAEGNTGLVSMGLDGTEDAVLVSVNIDQQPWTLAAESAVGGDGPETLYPKLENKTTTHPNIYYPIQTFYHGLSGITPASLADLGMAVIVAGKRIKVTNNSTSTATVTVKITRIWR